MQLLASMYETERNAMIVASPPGMDITEAGFVSIQLSMRSPSSQPLDRNSRTSRSLRVMPDPATSDYDRRSTFQNAPAMRLGESRVQALSLKKERRIRHS